MKPALNEIFAAMNGLVQGGVSVVKTGESTSHPMADLGVRAAHLLFDARARLLQGAFTMPVLQDKVARTCLAFLGDADNRQIMQDHSACVLSDTNGHKGGTVSQVKTHIDEMVLREMMSSEKREVVSVNDNGALKQAFAASYLSAPEAQKAQKPPRSPRAKAARRQPVKEASAVPVHALT